MKFPPFRFAVTLSRRAFLGFVLTNIACGRGASGKTSNWLGIGGSASGSAAPLGVRSGAVVFAPNPASSLATITMLTDSAGTRPWCVGQAFKPGDLPADSALDGVQMTVKSAWPDGSAKIAVLASVTISGGTSHRVPLGIGLAPSGALLTTTDLKATGITAAVSADPYGSAAWSGAEWDSPFTTWVSGPVMSSWVYRKEVGADDHLTAWLEVRLWATGDVEVLPWIENGYLLKGNPSDRPGVYSFELGGIERFSMSLPVWHHSRSPLISGAQLSHWLGNEQKVTPKHDREYLAETGLVQAYMSEAVKPEVPPIPHDFGSPVTFAPYQRISPSNSNHSPAMGMPGGHPSIGVQPGWEAVALTVDSVRAYEQLLRESYRFGQYHTHYRDEATNRPLRFSDHPSLGLQYNDPLLAVGDAQAGASSHTPYASGAVSMTWKVSHAPAAPLLAYLMTGRYWFMEECQFITTLDYLSLSPANRLHSGFKVEPIGQQMRSAAWMSRNLFIAICVTPDDDSLKADMVAAADANFDYFHTKYVVNPSNPFGMLDRGGGCGGSQAWQTDFHIGAWGRAIAWRLGSTLESRSKARDFFDWLSRAIVGRLGTTADEDFLYRCATGQAPGGSRVPFLWPGSGISMAADGRTITGTYPDYEGGTGPWWNSWGEMYDHTIVGQDGFTDKTDGDLGGGFWGDETGWWANLMNAAMAVASLDAPGARDAVSRMRSAPNWSWWVSQLTGTNRQPTNALDYVPLDLENFAHPAGIPAPGERLNINLNNASEIDYDFHVNGSQNGPFTNWWNGYGAYRSWNQMVGAWSGAIWAPEYGEKGATVCYGGGHGGNQGQFAYLFDFNAREWKQVGAPRNLPENFEWAGFLTSGDYNAAADQRDQTWLDYNHNGSLIKLMSHTYNTVQYVSPLEGGGPDGSLLIPTSPKTQNPSQFPCPWAPHLFDLSTGVMSRAMSVVPGREFQDDNNYVSVKDTRRNRIWYFRQGSTTCWYHDLTNGPPYTLQAHVIRKASGSVTDSYISGQATTYEYAYEADAVIRVNGYGNAVLNRPCAARVFDMSTGVPIDLKRNDIPGYTLLHGGYSPSVTWCSPQQAFYIYEGMGDDFCTVLRPSSLDFATCTWAWSREQFNGPEPVSRFPGVGLMSTLQGSFRRFQWHAQLGCFVWHDGPNTIGVCVDGVRRNGIVQLWRPPGKLV